MWRLSSEHITCLGQAFRKNLCGTINKTPDQTELKTWNTDECICEVLLMEIPSVVWWTLINVSPANEDTLIRVLNKLKHLRGFHTKTNKEIAPNYFHQSSSLRKIQDVTILQSLAWKQNQGLIIGLVLILKKRKTKSLCTLMQFQTCSIGTKKKVFWKLTQCVSVNYVWG